jgi:hypothetical protein
MKGTPLSLLRPRFAPTAFTTAFTTAVVAAFALGCADSTPTSAYMAPDSGGGSPDAGAQPDAPLDSGAVTPMDSGGGADTGSAAIAVPFNISDQFIPSGFMNDPTGLSLSAGANGAPACPTRAPAAAGNCYVVGWASTGPMWAGIYWQYPANNWGTEPGLMIAAGATQITFYARGDVGGEVVTFKSGGLNDPLTSAGAYGDSYAVAAPVVTLTTTWTPYTISLQGASYSPGVLGGFVFVAAATNGTNNHIKFYLDDLKWQ